MLTNQRTLDHRRYANDPAPAAHPPRLTPVVALGILRALPQEIRGGTGELAIAAEQIERAKRTLPFAWDRSSRAIDRLEEISEPSASLLASCVALNPSYQCKARFGLESASRGNKQFVVSLPEGEMRMRGAAKQQVPGCLDAVATHARPAESSPA